MIEIKTIGIWGFEGALRGCRMPYESFDKSDSAWYKVCEKCGRIDNKTNTCYRPLPHGLCPKEFAIGEADMALCKKLIKGGTEHRKFLRMIHVQVEIRAPRYFTQELATYKIGTVMNSSSTMHLITKRQLTFNDFSYEGDIPESELSSVISDLNELIDCYNEQTDKKDKDRYFMRIKQLLPESFMQRFVFDCNYEILLNIYNQRKNHRLTEWSGENGFCEWELSLPYFKEFVEAING